MGSIKEDCVSGKTPRAAQDPSEQKFALIFENSLDAIMLSRLSDGKYIDVNRGFSRLMGYTREEVIGRTTAEIDIWKEPQARRHLQDRLIAGGTAEPVETRFRRKDGQDRVGLVSAGLLTAGREKQALWLVHDVTDDLTIRAALQESEKRFRLMFDFTHSWEYWIGSDGRLVYVSPSCRHYTGYTPEEFVADNKLLLAIVHPDDREPFRQHLEHEADAPRLTTLEFRIVDRSGQERWISHTCQPIYAESRQFLGRRASNREVTDQKRAEIQNTRLTASLKSASQLLNAVLDAIPDVIGVQDRQHRIIRYNRAGYRMLGLPPEEVHGKKCHELIGHSTPCPVCATSETYRTAQSAKVEKHVPELGKWLDVRAYPILDENGELLQVIEHLRDITKEKTAEVELKAAHERLTTILDSIEAHIYVADMASHRILFINQKMKEDFRRDLVGDLCFEAFRCERKPCDHCSNRLLLDENGRPAAAQVWEGRNPVTGRWYLNHDRAIRWVDGRMVRLQIATDITRTKEYEHERARLEMQLKQSQKMEAIGVLAGGIAHDFNNILSAITGYVELAMLNKGAEAGAGELKEALRAAGRAKDLVKQILAFSRQTHEEQVPVRVGTIAKEASSFLRSTIPATIEIRTRIDEKSGTALANAVELHQILMNLCTNAMHAMEAGEGVLEIEVQDLDVDAAQAKDVAGLTQGPYIRVTVADTGVGMTPEVRKRIFEPYFTTKEKGVGTGLGLAVVHGIVEKAGGVITVQSEPGKGSIFQVYLPRVDLPVLPNNALPEALPGGAARILFVDDEKMLADIGQRMLERLGYDVVSRTSPIEALELFKAKPGHFDLVITDQTMPGMTGESLAKQLLRIRPGLPVILCTGYSQKMDQRRAADAGIKGFILKPVLMKEMAAAVRKAMAAEAGQQE